MSEIKDGGPKRPCIKCGVEFALSAVQIRHYDYRCLPCKRKMQNAKNLAKGDGLKMAAKARYRRNRWYWVKYAHDRQDDPIYKLKRRARRKVGTEIEAGRIKRQPCFMCGNVKSDAHHHKGYERPLDVQWLCRRCHIAEEKHAYKIAV